MGPYVLDFYCHDLKLAIELDGGQHNEAEQVARVLRRDAFMAARGVQTLRYWNDEVMSRTEEVLADVWSVVDVLAKPKTEEHTSELQSLMRISYAVFCLKK